MTPERLLIVYNAESGLLAGAKDSLHKLLSPDTYPCSLCALTHGTFRMDPAWKRFLARAPLDVRVYHRPDFLERYPEMGLGLPAVLVEGGRDARLLIGSDELRQIDSVGELIVRIEQALSASSARSP